jgi:REP element-mobilizing transposase RayT
MISGTKSLRFGRVSIPNQIYHVTTVTKDRHQYFHNFELSRYVVQSINTSPDVETLAYVVMPDHVHWLLKLQSSNISLSKTLSYVKNRSAGFAFKKFGIKGLWQKGFHDHAIRREENLIEIARYIVANPVRAGLVLSVRNYSYWDVKWL